MRSHSKEPLRVWLAILEAEMEVLAVTAATSRFYAAVREELRALGRPIPENDVWIAALAREHGLALLSRDSHFDFVPGLLRVGW